jgi:hypothetical protein
MTEANLRETAAHIRTHLLGLLGVFASPGEQRAYQAAVPFVPAPTELLCGWADDLYHPEDPVHALAFTSAERAALARFNAELRRWADAIPRGDLESFIGSVAGAALAGAANDALRSMGESVAGGTP